MRFFLVALSLMFTSHLANAQDVRSQIRDAALQISGAVGSSSLDDGQLSSILDQLNDIKAQLSGGSGGQLACVAETWSSSYVTRVSDGVRLGNATDPTTCSSLVAAARNNLVCAPNTWSDANVVNFATGQVLTQSPQGTDRCLRAVSQSNSSTVCVPDTWASATLVNIATGQRLGGCSL